LHSRLIGNRSKITQELLKNSIPEKMKKKSSDTFSKLNNQAKSNKIIPRNNKTLIYLIFQPESNAIVFTSPFLAAGDFFWRGGAVEFFTGIGE
jgi:hypothetical protein